MTDKVRMYKVYSCRSGPDPEKVIRIHPYPSFPLTKLHSIVHQHTTPTTFLASSDLTIADSIEEAFATAKGISTERRLHFLYACRLTGSGQATVSFLVHGQVTERLNGKQAI